MRNPANPKCDDHSFVFLSVLATIDKSFEYIHLISNIIYFPSACYRINMSSISGFLWYAIIYSWPSVNLALGELPFKLGHRWILARSCVYLYIYIYIISYLSWCCGGCGCGGVITHPCRFSYTCVWAYIALRTSHVRTMTTERAIYIYMDAHGWLITSHRTLWWCGGGVITYPCVPRHNALGNDRHFNFKNENSIFICATFK